MYFEEGEAILLKEELMSCTVERKEIDPGLIWVKLKVGDDKWMFVCGCGLGSKNWG